MEEEKKEIIKHIFHLEEKQSHKYEDPEAIMVDFQEALDMIHNYKKTHGDAIGEMDLLMKLFPSILRPNLARLTAEPAEQIHPLVRYVIAHLETTGKLLGSLYKEVQAEYRTPVIEIRELMKTLDPQGSIAKEINADIAIFLKA